MSKTQKTTGMIFKDEDALDGSDGAGNYGRVLFRGREVKLCDSAEPTADLVPGNEDAITFCAHGEDVATGEEVTVYWVFTPEQTCDPDGEPLDPEDYDWDNIDRIEGNG